MSVVKSKQIETKTNEREGDPLEASGLDDVLVDVANILAVDAKGVDDDEDLYYERAVTIEVPDDAADIHDISYISVPIRDVLTWFAENNPEVAERVLQLRDDFFAGDREQDYGHYVSPSTRRFMTPEERAVARVARSKGREARAAQRAALEADSEAYDEAERMMWRPFKKEREALEREREAHWERAAALDAEWEDFALERETWDNDRQTREEARRAELQAKTDALCADQEAWCERWAELGQKAYVSQQRED
ncbi:hypothetical protein [Allomesorhizobium alhagi]|uniref:Uncharacterized protein n=1 Tax=Mesorhizobium alhagi CCNWXJ12-2 TaxID=1107882 RepID=H0I092_9HYPH|nr:hypothetical protein [Mesorhizobium alhagi]EHK53638.1 hypothetical protein MAXJ12_29395 [Mesorhizobium alhagi CCNWXJ12-2]